MNKLIRSFNNPYIIILFFLNKTKLATLIPDKLYLKLLFRRVMGKKLNLENPQTFNEKLNWLKLNDRKPEYTNMVDKYNAKQYVADIIGDNYLIKTYGVWDKFDDIDFDKLPDQFVLKCTHDSGSVIICRAKSDFDYLAAKNKLTKALKRNSYLPGREWVYKDVKPRIIAEKYLDVPLNTSINDYKFFCFNGEPKCLFIATERHLGDEFVKFDFFDSEFNHLDIVQLHEQSGKKIEKPYSFEEMLRLSSILSAGMSHVRIDFYEIDKKPYFGEFTFYHHGGTIPFKTEKWDEILGSWIKLPEKSQN
ncbi:MAG TPA: ATP-grasp fold amidoligase family protein [Lutibacter sp.]